jgi:hypothetical protein
MKINDEILEKFYRRRLPHWQPQRAIYFVTWRVADGVPELAPAERDLVQDSLRFF